MRPLFRAKRNLWEEFTQIVHKLAYEFKFTNPLDIFFRSKFDKFVKNSLQEKLCWLGKEIAPNLSCKHCETQANRVSVCEFPAQKMWFFAHRANNQAVFSANQGKIRSRQIVPNRWGRRWNFYLHFTLGKWMSFCSIYLGHISDDGDALPRKSKRQKSGKWQIFPLKRFPPPASHGYTTNCVSSMKIWVEKIYTVKKYTLHKNTPVDKRLTRSEIC